MMNLKNIVIVVSFFLFLSSCDIIWVVMKIKKNNETEKSNNKDISVINSVDSVGTILSINEYIGWWVYGEGQHIFKDEESLEEWILEFPSENINELKELYLTVCEMEYFPMEFKVLGSMRDQDTLVVSDFEILYIQGCGE